MKHFVIRILSIPVTVNVLKIAAFVPLLVSMPGLAQTVSRATCAAELTKRYDAAADSEERLARAAVAGASPARIALLRERLRREEEYRRLREETCLDPRSPYPGPTPN
jgi:hypothetical protein